MTRDDLRELDFGVFESATAEQLCAGPHASAYTDWHAVPSRREAPPAGEEWDAFALRVRGVLGALREVEQPVMLVSHGYFIRAMIALALGMPHVSYLRRCALDPAAFSVIQLTSTQARLVAHNVGARLARRNDVE
jgi:broad specificity phosphatase PhoE